MANLHKAIRAIHNLVVSIDGNTQETIVATDKDGNEVSINWSSVNAWIEAQLPIVEFDMAMEDLRAKRNKDLQDSDWTQLPDNTLTSEQRNAWMQFRTELRNITDGLTTVEQVNNIDYPDKP